MKVEAWVFKGDGTVWVNVAAIVKYTGIVEPHNFNRSLHRIFHGGNIPHKILQVPKVRTTFLVLYQTNL